MNKIKYRYTWQQMLGDSTLNRLVIRISKRYLQLGEADIEWLVNEVLDSKRVIDDKEES